MLTWPWGLKKRFKSDISMNIDLEVFMQSVLYKQ